MFLTALYLWLNVVVLVISDNDATRASGFRYADRDNPINITESCNEKSPCIGKCCPANQILVLNISDDNLLCVDNSKLTVTYKSYNLTNLGDYSELEFYKNNIDLNVVRSGKKMEEFIQIYSDDFKNNSGFMDIKPYFEPPLYRIYLLENGSSVIRRLNYLRQWIAEWPPHKFCVERQISLDNGTVSKPKLVIRSSVSGDDGANETANRKNIIITAGLLVSCVFLALVLAVYALLPQLRNMAGMILMAYVATLIAAYTLRAAQVLATNSEGLTKQTCILLGLTGNYTVVSSFTWLNVMSFDIWWSMRGFRKLRQIHRRGLLVKFGWYSLYGWGAPLLLVIFMIVVENTDLSHLPNFIKSQYSDPFGCFITEESLFYLDAPILITTCINIMLFLMTTYNIWRIKQGVSQHSAGDSRRNRKDETRFGIYLKLSLVMGINWILEVASTLSAKESGWWYAPDIFNSLTGLLIFIIFICKRSIILLLCKRRFGIYLKLSLVMGINWILEVASTLSAKESGWWYAPDIFNSLTGLLIFIIFICKRSIILLLCKRFSIGHKLLHKWQPGDSNDTKSSRSNGRYSKGKALDSVTDASDVQDQEKSINKH